uniref:Probable Xaa-Pro aminopeptidase 3 n=1 Tax=Cacopsylla melanoneura TaxID=428564 RepID=A0A8D9AAW4_9HEMI
MINLCCYKSLLCFARKTKPRHLSIARYCTQQLKHEVDTTYPTCGQPTPTSHPYLLKPGELIPGFKVDDFVLRRHLLMKSIVTTTHANSLYNIVVIPSAKKTYMTEKIPYVFRQNTDFFYFTGCLEPDSVLVVHGMSDENFKTDMFVQKKDTKAELWDGPRTGIEVAPKLFAVNNAHPVENLSNFLQSLSFQHPTFCLWYDNTSNNESTNAVIKHFVGQHNKSWNVPKQLFHQLRLHKSENEQVMMRETCRIGSEAFVDTIGFSKPGRTEHQLFTKFDYEVRMRGAQILAYPPVVASGDNANVIHYIQNNQMCCDGDLLLMDAGCELNGYDSDITRTWPINGQFSDHQRVLYEIVLDTQLRLLKLCENLPSLDELFSAMCTLLGSALVENHMVTKTCATLHNYSNIGFKFCPHHSSHYLGMDVHDCASIPRTLPLSPGLVFTVEPGAYISKDCQDARPEFRGLGIRIEDDILIDKSGNVENLTGNCPKRVEEIEAVYAKRKDQIT